MHLTESQTGRDRAESLAVPFACGTDDRLMGAGWGDRLPL